AGNRRQRMGNWRDAADDAERGVLDNGEPVIAAEDIAFQKLDARRSLAKNLELLDLVLQPPDLCLLHFHRAELNTGVDRNAADVVDDPLSDFQTVCTKLLERLAGRSDSLVSKGKHAVPAGEIAATGCMRRGIKPWPIDLGQNLLHYAADQIFRRLHVL